MKLSEARHFYTVLSLAVFLAYPSLIVAQTSGTITGTVTDPSGSAIPGATVTVTNVATGVVARTAHHEPRWDLCGRGAACRDLSGFGGSQRLPDQRQFEPYPERRGSARR
jgi:hypothetical protein